MKNYFIILLTLVSFFSLRSQGRKQVYSSASGYTFCDWDKITYKPDYVPTKDDTAIVFVTVRNYFDTKEFYLDYGFDTSNTLHCFIIYFNQNKWTCVPKKNLKEAINICPKSESAAVYVEGFGKTFPGSVDRATRLTRTYDVLTIYFDWPTLNPEWKPGKNYFYVKRISKSVAKPFSVFLKQLEQFKKESTCNYKNFTLFMHSMGNLLLMNAVKKDYIDSNDVIFKNIILNAPCVNQARHRKWIEKLKTEDKIYVMVNRKDKILKGATYGSMHKQLGRHPKRPYAKNATYINYSAVLTEEHNYFLFTYVLKRFPDIKKVYSTIFSGGTPAFEDPKKYRKSKKGNEIIFLSQDPPKNRDLG